MRALVVFGLVFGLANAAQAATKFTQLHPYTNDYNQTGLYPKGFSVALKDRGKRITVTNLGDHRKFYGKLDAGYKARDARFKGYSMFRGQFKLERFNVEDREVLIKVGAIAKNRAYVRFHGDQWGGIEIFVNKK